ncbi:MAG: biopolymer transporter ExbD [Candidatus Eisenbacteria bacterium]
MRGYLVGTAIRERKRRGSEQAVVARLQLTSLIDIFTVLLLFLLKSLVVGGAVVSPFPGVTLPPSSSTATFKESPVVVVTRSQVVVDGAAVCPTDQVMAQGELKVPALEQALDAVRQKTEGLAERAGSSRKFEGKLILQADESIPFHVLQKVMYTSQTVGFYDITLAVIQK